MKNIAVIPARGGSKRIHKKNIKEIGGLPTIGWPIKTAFKSACFDRVIVSTDDQEIASIANNLGAEIPFIRSKELSDDYTGTTEVVRDAVKKLNLSDEDRVCCIYATAIFMNQDDLFNGKKKLNAGAKWVFSVGRFSNPIERAYVKNGEKLFPRNIDMMLKRSQDCEAVYFDCGQFYWALASTWKDTTSHVWDGAEGIEIPKIRAIDIDEPEDFEFAEKVLNSFQGR
jgi:N-acylneuraminate cytidylyltransferase